MSLPVARRPLATLAVIALLPGCASISLDAPAPVPSASPTAAARAVPGDAVRYPAPRTREPPAAPIESPALPVPAVAEAPPVVLAAAVPPQPLPPAALTDAAPMPPATTPSAIQASVAPQPAAPPPARAPAALALAAAHPEPSAAMRPAAAPVAQAARSAAEPAAGRWSVQVGVFAVARNAETVRARTEARLAQAGIAGAAVRTVERDGRTHVVAGELADRTGAWQLAARLRTALQQDVVLFRW